MAGSTDKSGASFFNLAAKKLSYLSHRQKVVAQNVLNTRTPKYLPQDTISFKNTLRAQQPINVSIKRTSGNHLEGTAISHSFISDLATRDAYSKQDLSPSGNAVVLEKELMKSGEIGLEYKLTSTLTSEYMKLRKLALSIKK